MAKRQSNVDAMFEGLSGSSEALGRARRLFRSAPPRLSEGITEAQPQPLDRMLDNPFQPRLEIRQEELDGLVESIRLYGFRGTLLGRPAPDAPGYIELAYGHRRREASKQAGLTSIPLEMAELSDQEMAALAAVENIQREDLSPLEEGRLYQLMIEQMGYTQVQVAGEIGKSRGYVENRLRAADAPSDVQAMVAARPNTLHYVPKLTKIEDERLRRQVIAEVLAGRLTGDEIDSYLADQQRGSSQPASNGSTRLRPAYGRGHLDVALRSVEGFRRGAEARDSITTDDLVKLRHIRDELSELLARYDIVG